MRPDYQTSPLLWLSGQLGRFLGDGYREIRGLIANNAPVKLKRVFTGSMAAVVLALLTVIVIGLIVENLIFRTIERNTVQKWGTQS